MKLIYLILAGLLLIAPACAAPAVKTTTTQVNALNEVTYAEYGATTWEAARLATECPTVYPISGGFAMRVIAKQCPNAMTNVPTFWIERYGLIFDTSAIPATASITSATLNVWIHDHYEEVSGSAFTVGVVRFTPDNPAVPSPADYNIVHWGTTASPMQVKNLPTGGYYQFAVQPAMIVKGGITGLGIRHGNDISGTKPVFTAPYGFDEIMFHDGDHPASLTIQYQNAALKAVKKKVRR